MRKFWYSLAAIAMATAGFADAQQAGFARIALQTQDVCTPGKIAVQVRGEFEPGVATGRHTHSGEELTYILEGQIELRIDGQPPRVVKAGETFFVPATGQVACHDDAPNESGNWNGFGVQHEWCFRDETLLPYPGAPLSFALAV
jgi:quercetin dioxygenase-like cupin family protein